jgi:hypothetical protein
MQPLTTHAPSLAKPRRRIQSNQFPEASHPARSIKASKYRRNFARHATQACTPCAESLVKKFRGIRRCQHFFDEFVLRLKAFAAGVAFVLPMSQEPGTRGRMRPEAAAVFESRHIVIVWVWPPNFFQRVRRGCLFHAHGRYYSRLSRFAQVSCARSLGSLRFRLGTNRSATAGTSTVKWP